MRNSVGPYDIGHAFLSKKDPDTTPVFYRKDSEATLFFTRRYIKAISSITRKTGIVYTPT